MPRRMPALSRPVEGPSACSATGSVSSIPPPTGGCTSEWAAHGLLITEFPPGERPHAGSFPQRNRLISGLARVTVVVEAAAGSGALITASAALEQGREVLAVPGPVTSSVSVGSQPIDSGRGGAVPRADRSVAALPRRDAAGACRRGSPPKSATSSRHSLGGRARGSADARWSPRTHR